MLINIGQCWKCKCEIALPEELYNAANRSRSISFFCAYGHPGIFVEGETDLDKMRRERDRLKQQIAERDDAIKRHSQLREAAEASAKAFKGHVTRIRNRVGHGVCPCCNRSFENLARHMNTEHPDFAKDAAE